MSSRTRWSRLAGFALAVARRFGAFLATLAGATLLAQLLLWLAPGDPADLLAEHPALRERLVEEFGLDEPLLVRYLHFVSRAARGDLGTSLTYRPGTPVSELVAPAALRSLSLVLGALAFSFVAAVALAYRTTTRRGRFARRAVQVASVPPVFLLAYVAMVALNESTFAAIRRGWIDRPAWFALPDQDSALKVALAIAVLALGSSTLTELHAACDAELRRLRKAPFVDAARARGARLWPHLLWNLVPPLTTLVATRTAFFVGGLVIVEKVLHLNGVGSMLWQACRLRDYPLALGITVVAAALVCAARLAGDVVRLAFDPRLRTAP